MKTDVKRLIPLVILASALLPVPLMAQHRQSMSVWQGGSFITAPEKGAYTVIDNPETGCRTVEYDTPSMRYTYVIDGNYQLIRYEASITDPKMTNVFLASEMEVRKTEKGYEFRKKRGGAGWETLHLPVQEKVIYFGGMAHYLERHLKSPESLPPSGKLTVFIPPFLPVEMNYTIRKTASDRIPREALPLTDRDPPETFRQFQQTAQPIYLAEFKLTGLAWVFFPHAFHFALSDNENPTLLANWGGRTDTEDYFIVYSPEELPVSAVCR